VLGLKGNYAEADLEKVILIELEKFILEVGHAFAFVDRQKRMTMDGDDFKLDFVIFPSHFAKVGCCRAKNRKI